ncbi:MAG: Spy/CpxP family protein refolding chaperone [Acidobacteriota bacterium]|nr:Spy/CpxP family protein refolding chaperone [Acidobacteriota bacterium]
MKTSLNRSIRIARTLLPALLVVAATAFAAVEEGEDRQSRRGARGDFAERDAERMARVLQLTEDQKEQWRRLREEHEASVGPLMRQMRDITERLESEANLENPDPTVVGQLELDRRAVARQLRTSRIQVDEDLKRLLDRDQTIRWEALRENGRGGFRGRFGPGSRGPRPRN